MKLLNELLIKNGYTKEGDNWVKRFEKIITPTQYNELTLKKYKELEKVI